MKQLDLTGYWSGGLEFIRPIGRTERGAVLWECLCHHCGRTCQIVGNRVHDKRPPKDCGCRKREKEADLTGQIFGALEVLERAGNCKSGDRQYMCRCTLCGREKLLPAGTIRSCPKSCGCQQYNSHTMAERSKAAVAAKFRDVGGGKLVDLAVPQTASARSKTGVRGVYPEKKQPGTYRCSVTVAGETIIRTGFASIEEARAAREGLRRELREKYGIENAEKEKKQTC